ncbi:MAG: class I SAM-dependent methyltransferase [Nitrososphaerales archaeon]|nr:class I SAM-dependent methyltransferase [Nitrososphaerales archaeon]
MSVAVYRLASRMAGSSHVLLLALPFTFYGLLWRALRSSSVILELGCGEYSCLRRIGRGEHLIGADTSVARVRVAKSRRYHDDYVVCDVNNMPFRPKLVDAIVGFELVEHLKEEEARNLINQSEILARKIVVFSTPNGFVHLERQDDPSMTHKSGFTSAELKRMNFRVLGAQGLQVLYPRNELNAGRTRTVLWLLSHPFAFFLPEEASTLLFFKRIH